MPLKHNILTVHSFIKPEGQEGAILIKQLVATFTLSLIVSRHCGYGVNSLIKFYFSLGMHYGDILSTLASQGIVISQRLKVKGITSRIFLKNNA